MTSAFRMNPDGLQRLLALLQQMDYETIGPTMSGDAITYDRIASISDLPVGWTDEQAPGIYRLVRGDDREYFGYTLPAQSWKRFLYPPFRKLFSIKKNGRSLELDEAESGTAKYAFIGVRACELSAISIQDKVFNLGEYRDDNYLSLRKKIFVVAVNCSHAGDNCFCTSMKTGPGAKHDFDIALTEILKEGDHYFIAEAGTEAGSAIIEMIGPGKATDDEIAAADNVVRETAAHITKSMDTRGLPELLADNLEHSQWEDVAKRCLTCGNCTMVCPTCFCSTVEDATDLSGQVAERFRRWDSCFTMDFAKVSGGNFRISPKSRYRQWLTHKLSSWVDQFGVSGCVGCGRCIAWCPVGIDLTAEVKAIRGTSVKQEKEV